MSYQSFTTSPYLYGRSIYAVPRMEQPIRPIASSFRPRICRSMTQSILSLIPPMHRSPGTLKHPAHRRLKPRVFPRKVHTQEQTLGNGELRPGMILSDGAQVLSVGPTNGSAQHHNLAFNPRPPRRARSSFSEESILRPLIESTEPHFQRSSNFQRSSTTFF